MPELVGDLEVDQDLKWQERAWKANRVGWGFIAAFIVAALIGLFGVGPISVSTATSEDGELEVAYQNFGRRGGPTEVDITIQPQLVTDGKVAIVIDAAYYMQMTLEQVAPQPDSVEVAEDHAIYTFAVADGEPATITLSLTSDTIGSVDATIGVDGGPEVNFSQFFFP